MGISDFGEMDRLAKIAKPDIGVITNIGTCHLENLGDRDGVLKEKSCMLKFLQPGGVAVLNGDDDKLSTLQNRFKEVVGVEPVKLDFFGVREEGVTELLPTADLKAYATDIENLGLDGVAMKLHAQESGEKDETSFDARISIPGRHNVYNALAATCVGLELGLSIEEIQKGLAEAKTIQGRTNLIHHKDMILIDDCYNANPMSMKEALHVLENAKGRKIAVLGDMGELGEREAELHGEVGEAFAASTVDTAFLVGKLMKNFQEKAKKLAPEKEVYYFEDRESMTKALLDYVKAGDAVLVKASHFMQFPKVIDALMEK
jgi:UDP-N-acetylmuramoyl-tripeptide--D-alanyl-D-alanine ligase